MRPGWGPIVTSRRLCLLAALSVLPSPQSNAEGRLYKVIVNTDNRAKEVKRNQVALLFLDRRARWSFGAEGRAVDQSLASLIRETFSEEVLGQVPAAIQHCSGSGRRLARSLSGPTSRC